MALSTIASEQAKGTQNTMLKTKQLMDYMATHPNATVRFNASDMIMNVHSDASYLSEANAHSRACGHFFHGMEGGPHKTHQIKRSILHTMCNFMLRRRFHCQSQTWCPLPQLQTGSNILTHSRPEMGHLQTPMLVHYNNSTAVGNADNSVKQQRSRAMEMRFFGVADAVEQGKFDIKYYPGKENLAEYQSKHHIGAHHTAVRPWYLHKLTSVCELPRADKPSTLTGCVRTLTDGYVHTSPLP
jgi:hypothetical protein